MSASLALSIPTFGAEPGKLIDDMNAVRFRSPAAKGKVELVEGKVDRALEFSFDADARGVFFISTTRPTPDWDQAEGFSFWVKGAKTGGDGFGGIEFIYDEDYAVRYDFAFPVKQDTWTKIEVAWSDLVPVLPGPRNRPLGLGANQNLPSKLSGPWFGKWWYWGNYPALSYSIDEMRLEPKLARNPVPAQPEGSPLGRIAAKLKAGKPVTIVTMGDSLTDKRHWANRQTAWVDLLQESLKSRYQSKITLINPAIGGTQLRQNLVLMPTWLAQNPEPDLVLIFFGGNDWDAGMRGEEFTRVCSEAIDRVRQATHGKADVLLMTTNPAAIRWGATKELAAACRSAAKARNAGLADTERAFEQAAGSAPNRLFVDDRVHLSRLGHELVAKTVLEAIEAALGERPPSPVQ